MIYDIVTGTCSAFYWAAQRLFLFLFGQTFLHRALNQAFRYVVGRVLGSALGSQLLVCIQKRHQLLQPVALHRDLHAALLQCSALARVCAQRRRAGKLSSQVLGKLGTFDLKLDCWEERTHGAGTSNNAMRRWGTCARGGTKRIQVPIIFVVVFEEQDALP